jgi:hypothetical protein
MGALVHPPEPREKDRPEDTTWLYHEPQKEAFCGLHALNMLVQVPEDFSKEDLKACADKLSEKEEKETGRPRADIEKELFDKKGNYDMSVLVDALLCSKYGAKLEQVTKLPDQVEVVDSDFINFVRDLDAAICHNGNNHFIAYRRIDGHVWEFDSLNQTKPVPIHDFGKEVRKFKSKKYTLFTCATQAGKLHEPKKSKEDPGELWTKVSDLLKTSVEGDKGNGGGSTNQSEVLALPQSSKNQSERLAVPESSTNQSALMYELWREMDFYSLMHSMSSEYYRYRYFCWDLIPSSALTMISAVLAFLSTSEPTAKARYSIVIGCLAVVATFLKALSSFLAYDSRHAMHQAAGVELAKLRDNIAFDLYERTYKNNGGSSNSDEAKKPPNTIGEYRKAFKQARTACKASIPAEISSVLEQYRNMTKYLVSGEKIDFGRQHFILSTASDTFLATVTEDTCYLWAWPICIRKQVLEKALDNLEYALDPDLESSSPAGKFETLKKVYFKKEVKWGKSETMGTGSAKSGSKMTQVSDLV